MGVQVGTAWRRGLSRMIGWLVPQVADEDHSRRHTTELLAGILLATGLVIALNVIWRLVGWPQSPVFAAQTLLAALAVDLLALAMLRRGLVTAAGRAVIWGSWVAITVLAATGQGAHDTVVAAYIMCVMVAGLLLLWWDVYLLLAVSVAAVWSVALAESHGYQVYVLDAPAEMARDWTSVLVLAAALVLVYASNLGRYQRRLVAELAERRRAENEAAQRELSFRQMFEAMPDAVVLHDADTGAVVDLNGATERLCGWRREELIGRTVGAYSGGDPVLREAEAIARVHEAAQTGQPLTFEWRSRRADGDEFWSEVRLQRCVIGGVTRVLAVVRDIGERKAAVQALRESEQRLRSIVEAVPDAIFIANAQGRFLHVNPAACRQLGYSSDELLTKSVFDIAGAAYRARAKQRLLDRSPAVAFSESMHRRKDGREVPVELAILPMVFDNQNCMLGIARDITERLAAQQAVRDSERRYRLLAENAADVVCLLTLDGRVEFVSEAVERQLDLRPEEIVGRNLATWVHPDDLPLARQAVHACANDGGSGPIELRLRQADGRWLWCEVRGSMAEPAEPGGERHVIAAIRDIRARRQAEEALRESEGAFRTVFEESPFAVCLQDTDGVYEAVNNAFAELIGRGRAEIIGRPIMALQTAPGHPLLVALREQLQQHGALNHQELTIRRADGQVAHLLFTARRLSLHGQPHSLTVLQDITARKAAEAEREALIRQLEQSNAELERFTYTVSHDLKSPLITIQGFLGWLRADLTSGRADRLDRSLDRIDKAAGHMAHLLDELLELSRIGRLVNPPEDVRLGDLVSEVADLLATTLAERGVTWSVVEPLPVVHGDRQRLLEVIQNLVDNAAKYTDGQPEPRITIGQAGVEPGSHWPVVYVRDNGDGFEPAHAERIFGLFEQLNPGRGGTGIGLTLVRRIVETHGGRVWAESAGRGQGASFYFTLPPAAQPTEPPAGGSVTVAKAAPRS